MGMYGVNILHHPRESGKVGGGERGEEKGDRGLVCIV